MIAETDLDSILAAAREIAFTVPIIPVLDLVVEARRAHNVYWKGRPPAASDERLAVDYLRHLSGWREATSALHTIPGSRKVRIELNDRLLGQIARAYPSLAGECERLQRAYRAQNSPAPKRRPAGLTPGK